MVDPQDHQAIYREVVTVKQLMKEYVELHGLNHWSESTLSCNRHRINDYILPYIGGWKLKDITTRKLEVFYQDLMTKPAVQQKGHRPSTVSRSVVEKVHCIIRSALNQAIRWDYLRGANPAMTVELPRCKKTFGPSGPMVRRERRWISVTILS